MRPFFRVLAAGLLPAALVFASCTKSGPAPRPDARGLSATSLDPALTVATVNGAAITAGELDGTLESELAEANREHVERVHQLRREHLEQLITQRLLDTEAKAQDVSKEELLAREVREKAGEPSDEDVQDAYDRFVKGRFDFTFEQAKEQLRMQLAQEKMAVRARAYLDELKAKHAVKVSLPAPEAERVSVAATGPSTGAKDAKVTIVTFSDFQCPFCSRAKHTVDEVMKQYGDRVKLVFRQYPLPFHDKAAKAAEASLCAEDQNKFWAFHDRLFEHQSELAVDELKAHAREVGLDGEAFDACLDGGAKAEAVAKDMAEAQQAKVNGTPAFFINGRMLSGAQPFDAFQQIIEDELSKS